jgi:pyrimidine-nucleoside phosphorylase
LAENALKSGSALEKFRQLVIAQGGDVSFVDKPEKLPISDCQMILNADKAGYISQVHAQTIGETAVDLGAGRVMKTDKIDPGVGILVHIKVGDQLEKGDPLFTIFSRNSSDAEKAAAVLLGSLKWSDTKVKPLPLFYGVIGKV